jgi:hypothetical protein
MEEGASGRPDFGFKLTRRAGAGMEASEWPVPKSVRLKATDRHGSPIESPVSEMGCPESDPTQPRTNFSPN